MKRIPKDAAAEIPFAGLESFSSEFKASRSEELITLHSALKASDYVLIERMCHTWKGFAVPYGFGELAHLATDIEAACEKKDHERCQELLKDVENYLSSK